MNKKQSVLQGGNSKGSYALVLELTEKTAIAAGCLGQRPYPKGYYVYIGSAFGPGGLNARIGRHLKPEKKYRWHIDYLRRFAEILEIWYTFHPEKVECHWAEILQQTRGAHVICPGFGASDCRCRTHLFFLKKKPGLATFKRKARIPVLAMTPDARNKKHNRS